MVPRKLDEILVQAGLVDEQSLALARTEALARQRKLAEIVIDLGLIDQRSLAALVARESGFELVSPIDTRAARAIASAVPAVEARRLQIVPVRRDPEGLVIAMIDPFEPGVVELVEAATGVPVTRAVGVRSEIEMAVLELYHVEDEADRTIQLSALGLELGSAFTPADGESPGIPDEWHADAGDEHEFGRAPVSPASRLRDAESTAPSSAGKLTDTERIAHVERQLLSVSRALALIQARLDSIDARLATLGSQAKTVK